MKVYSITMLVHDASVVVTEHLRYMGIISVGSDSHTGHPPTPIASRFPSLSYGDALVTVSVNPRKVNAEVWMKQNLERLRSFGVHAVAFSMTDSGRIDIHGDNR